MSKTTLNLVTTGVTIALSAFVAIFIASSLTRRAASQVPSSGTQSSAPRASGQIGSPTQPGQVAVPPPGAQVSQGTVQAPNAKAQSSNLPGQQPFQGQSAAGQPASNPADIASMVSAPKNLLSGIIEKFEYDPLDKRDPFLPYSPTKVGNSQTQGPVLPLQRFDLEQLQVVGIMWDIAEPKAMIIDPQGKTNLVMTNDRIGRNNGYVAAIREGEIVVIEAFDNAGSISYKTKVLKMTNQKE